MPGSKRDEDERSKAYWEGGTGGGHAQASGLVVHNFFQCDSVYFHTSGLVLVHERNNPP